MLFFLAVFEAKFVRYMHYQQMVKFVQS